MLCLVVGQQVSILWESVEFGIIRNLIPDWDHGRRLTVRIEPDARSWFISAKKADKFGRLCLVGGILGNANMPTTGARSRFAFLEIRKRSDNEIHAGVLKPAYVPFASAKDRHFSAREKVR